MNALTKLEQAVLRSIFSETPDSAIALEHQMAVARVTKRENTGAGFFTTVAVPAVATQVSSPRVLGYETHARVQGLEHGMGFVLFMEDERLSLLEGYTWGLENTASLDFLNLAFDVFKASMKRIG